MKRSHTLLALSLVIGMTGCASSSVTSEDGEPRFPDLDSSYLETGDFIDPENVLSVAKGQHKDQVRLLLQHPHFSEGIFNVREWDYAFNFYTGAGGDYITCQYKVMFDRNNRVEHTYWRNPHCPALLVPIEIEEEKETQTISLTSDVLFDFDSAALTLEGERALQRMADQLRESHSDPMLMIVGYTDRLGSVDYNLNLSRERAEAVKNYLVGQGMPAQQIVTEGRGMADPVVDCPGNIATSQVKECLQPNRRVEVTVTAAE